MTSGSASWRLAALAALLLAAGVIFALPLGRRPLASEDEARFALLAQEAVEHGRWILPRVRDVVYLNKPPLFFWTVALVSLPFGQVTEATAAVPSVLAAVAGLLAVFAIGRLLWGWTVGLVSALALATAPFYFFMAHHVLSDMLLTAWLTWALYFFLSARERGDGVRPLLGFYLCLGGALATKGPVALVALLAAVVVMAVDDGWRGFGRLRLPMGAAILLLSVLPWLLPYLLQHERSYVGSVVVGHYLDWIFRSRPGYRFAAALSSVPRFLPWAIFLPPAAWWWWRSPHAGRRRLLVWEATLVVAVSLSAEQRARYFLPLFPVLSLLVAEFLVRGAAEPSGRGRRVALAATAVGLLLTVGLAVFVLAGPASWVGNEDAIFLPSGGWERWVVALLVVGGPAAALVALRSGSGAGAAVSLGLAMGAVLAVEGAAYPARYARWYDVRSFVTRVESTLPSDGPIAVYHEVKLSYDFYLRRPVRELRTLDEVATLLGAPNSVPLLTTEEGWGAVRLRADPSWQPLVSGTVGRRRMVLVVRSP